MNEEVGSEVAEQTSAELALGKQLQAARQAAGLTQQQMCQKAGMSYSTLAKIERGAIKSPSVFTVAGIADALNTSVDELLGRESTASAKHEASDKKTSKNGVKFVFFDINGCLVRFFHRAFTRIAEETGAEPDRIESVFWHLNDEVCRGEMSMEEFEKTFASKLNVDKVEWQRFYLEEVDPIPEMHELVAWADENYHIGLLSNIMPGLIDAMKQKGLIPDLNYDAIIDSSEVGAIKPEQKMYEIAQEKTGLPAEQIMLVDDDRTNLVAADKLGWHVLWFDDYRPSESAEKVRSALSFE